MIAKPLNNQMRRGFVVLLTFAVLISCGVVGQGDEAAVDEPRAEHASYLSDVCAACRVEWPANRAITIVCHGHSVPAGYFVTPEVRSLEAYPHLLRVGLAERFPHAVINVIVTAIGGETSVAGARRFEEDVLAHRPDVVTIDYGLNDRRIGLERARRAWIEMIEKSKSKGVKVLLLTPSADLAANLDDPSDPLNLHADQIRELARVHKTGLVDSLDAFQKLGNQGGKVAALMSQENHPNKRGHELISREMLRWFP